MPKCVRCEDTFTADEGEYNEDKEFVCAMCADLFEEDLDDEDDDLDDEDDEDGVKAKVCPSCKEKSPDYAESGICPECGFEKDE